MLIKENIGSSFCRWCLLAVKVPPVDRACNSACQVISSYGIGTRRRSAHLSRSNRVVGAMESFNH